MKDLKIACAILFLMCTTNTIFAQKTTPQFIEADLLKSFKMVTYWSGKEDDTHVDAVAALDKANAAFRDKLRFYTSKYSFTIDQKFPSLVKEHLNVSTSDDKLLRAYSWENGEGDFDNIIQYKWGQQIRSVLFTDTIKKGDEGYVGGYTKLFTLKNKQQNLLFGGL